MTKLCESLEKKKSDATEFLEILDKVPEERKSEVLCIVKGFALCAEIDAEIRSASDDGRSGIRKP